MTANRPALAAALAEGRSTVRRFGPRPVRIAGATFQRLQDRPRLRRLRTTYHAEVADPRGAAMLRSAAIDLPPAELLPSELDAPAAALREEAELVLAHRVDYLGSGLVSLGSEIDWHADFKSGYRWPASFYQDVEVTRLDDDSDAKVPWELSRGHQLLTLARAARLYRDERMAAELEAQLCSWLDANPPGAGINWVNAMEISLRAVNWIWAIDTLEGLRPLDADLRARVSRSLQSHGRHVARHLEGSPLLRGNHYLADILGLLALGERLPDDPEASRWRSSARSALEREIRLQVLDDGVGFEASLPYHGLSLEIFLLAWHLAAAGGRPLSSRYRARLMRMLEVSRSVRHPDGRCPVFGDQDSGRVLPAGFARPATHDNLIDLGAGVLGLARQRDAAPDPEVAWTLGIEHWRALAARPAARRSRRAAFRAGGLYVLRGGNAHMVVRWGGVGQNGNGGHAHNDLSSYELSYGTPLVVDSGTYVYTADVAARDRFRCARAHNVLVVDDLDMHPLPAGEPFQLPAHASARVEEWSGTRDDVVLVGSHDGFRRPGRYVRCQRRITLSQATGAVEIVDRAMGTGRRKLESLVHLAPGCEVVTTGDATVRVHSPSTAVWIEFTGADAVTVSEGEVSDCYGVREPAPVVSATATADLPHVLGYRILPA